MILLGEVRESQGNVSRLPICLNKDLMGWGKYEPI